MQADREVRSTVEALEVQVREHLGQLNCAVRTEVQEDYGVSRFYKSYRITCSIYNDSRFNELVKHGLLIGFSDRLNRIGILRTIAINDSAVRLLYPLPAFVAVHGIIAALNRSDFTYAYFFNLGDQPLQESLGAVWSHITAIQERMDIHFMQIFLLGKIQHSEQMINMAVYAAIGQQAVQMKLLAVGLRVLYSFNQGLVRKEITFTDRLVDTGQILIHDPACTDVQMTYFRVTHLSFRQTHSLTASSKRSVRVHLKVSVVIRFVRLCDRVAFICTAKTESVHDDQCYRFGC
ncbi:hypothetical protein D3C81_826320 [compost metagenome]